MNSNYALVDGNLALSDSHTDTLAARSAYQTEILTFPAPSRQCVQAPKPLHAALRAVQPARSQTSQNAHRLISFIVASFVTIAMIALMLGSLFTVLGSETSSFEQALVETERTTVSVAPGDTLWNIAEEHGVEGLTTQQSVDLIRTWNDLEQSTLQPGMELIVPVVE